jgi:hypothetical protein
MSKIVDDPHTVVSRTAYCREQPPLSEVMYQ